MLQRQSGKGGLHENTLLLVMGDHGQTVNGDHGGGSPEEVYNQCARKLSVLENYSSCQSK